MEQTKDDMEEDSREIELLTVQAVLKRVTDCTAFTWTQIAKLSNFFLSYQTKPLEIEKEKKLLKQTSRMTMSTRDMYACKYGKVCIWETGSPVQEILKEHHRNIRFAYTQNSVVSEHANKPHECHCEWISSMCCFLLCWCLT